MSSKIAHGDMERFYVRNLNWRQKGRRCPDMNVWLDKEQVSNED